MASRIDRYDYAFDPDGTDWPARLLRQVPAAGAVLELGPGAGAMTRALLARGQAVTVVENDAESVALLQELDCEVVPADLDGEDWDRRLGGRKFDAILACDVLEHLKQPEQVLQTLRSLAGPECALVISMPNVAYAGVIAGLCQGLFEYADKGILDRTHLKFFTRSSFERLLHECGWAPLHWEGNQVPVEHSEFVWQWQALPPMLRQVLAAAPYAHVYQWMGVATPVEEAVAAEIRQARADAREVREQLQALTLRHEAEHASLQEHQKAFGEAKQTISEFEQQRDELHAQLEQARQSAEEYATKHEQASQQIEAQAAQLCAQAEYIEALREEVEHLQEAGEHLPNHSFAERAIRALRRRIRGRVE